MPLTGLVDFVSDILHSTPANMWPLIGEDGKHYVGPSVDNYSSGILKLGCAETNTITYTRSEAQWRTDLAGLGMGTSGTYNVSSVVPAPGTPYFFIVGGGDISAGNESHNVGVRHKIVSTASVVVDGGFANIRAAGGGLLYRGGSVGQVFGSQVIGSSLYAVHLLDNPGSWLRYYLVKYDLTGTDANLTVGSWEDRVTHITAWDSAFFTSSTSRQYYNRVSLLDQGDGTIRLFAYVGVPEIAGSGSTTIDALSAPTLLSCVVDPVAHTCSASSDVSSLFGIPFSDAGLNYADAVGSSRDDYTSPSINGTTNEIRFPRSFSDNRQYEREQRFLFNGISDVINLGQTTFQFTEEITFSSDLEFVQTWREGGDLLVTARDTRRFFFGQISLGSPRSFSRVWG